MAIVEGAIASKLRPYPWSTTLPFKTARRMKIMEKKAEDAK